MNQLPGNTDLSSYEKSDTNITSLLLPLKRPVAVFATNDVNDESLFRNGLTQNILILYDLFESIGYESYLLQFGANSTSEKKTFLSNYRSFTAPDVIKNNLPIKILIEIGMSLDAPTREYVHSIGGKIIKLYLGNILNIDIETIQNFKTMFFNHHIIGEIDEIWTSPHYKQHVEYAAILNQTEIKNSRVAPYVWDPCFLKHYLDKELAEWSLTQDWTKQDIVIMDPNISFQKCFFYPLLLVEAFSKKHPEWKGKVHIINGDRIKVAMHSYNFVLSSLSIYKTNRVVLHDRKNIYTILKDHKSSCFITHQWNNDFNYMTLELLYCSYPVLHNSEGWNNFGYYYDINKWDNAVDMLYKALRDHTTNINIYKSHAANLIWKHSIHNPEMQSQWKAIVQ